MCLGPPGQIPVQVFIQISRKSMENGPGASWTVSFTFAYLLKPCYKSSENATGGCWLGSSSHFFIKALFEITRNAPSNNVTKASANFDWTDAIVKIAQGNQNGISFSAG